jgi:hypothetical protein
MAWLALLVAVFVVPVFAFGVVVSLNIAWRRGVAHGKAEGLSRFDVMMGLLGQRIQEREAAKEAGAPSGFQCRLAEEVADWAASVVKLWKNPLE